MQKVEILLKFLGSHIWGCYSQADSQVQKPWLHPNTRGLRQEIYKYKNLGFTRTLGGLRQEIHKYKNLGFTRTLGGCAKKFLSTKTLASPKHSGAAPSTFISKHLSLTRTLGGCAVSTKAQARPPSKTRGLHLSKACKHTS